MDSIKETPALLPWAKLPREYQGCVMVRGGDLQPGDVVYFVPGAYGRELFVKQSDTRWSAMVLKPGKHFRGDATIYLDNWYVTRRVSAPKTVEGISRLRVDGDDLAVGDVLDMPGVPTNYRAEILELAEPTYGDGWQRAAILRLANGDVRAHTFKNRSQWLFTVVGGPKITRANTDPSTVLLIATGVLWKGGR